MTRLHTAAVLTIILVVLAAVTTVGFVGAVGAGDSATILEVEPETAEAPPGETIHVAIIMTSDGGYGGVGVERVAFGIEYDSDIITVEDVHHGPWMEQGNETEIVTEHDIDNGAGYTHVEQHRDPAAGGATGHDRIATLTVSVASDADGAESPIALADVESELTNDWPLQSYPHNGTVVVDEDSDVVEATAPESAAEENGDDSVPGFGIAGSLVAVVGALLARATLRRF